MIRLIYDSLKYNDNCHRSRTDILNLSLHQFHKIVKRAYIQSPFYRELYTSHGIKYRDLSRLEPSDFPIIDKEIVRPNFDRIATIPLHKKPQSEDYKHFNLLPGVGYLVHTSGSTGKPCSFLYSKSAVTALESNFVRLSTTGGKNPVTLSDFPIRSLHIASTGIGYASMLLAQNGLKNYHAKSIVVETSTPIEEWKDKIGDFSPSYLSGYPSCVELVAEMQQAGQLNIRPKKIITGGEPMGKGEMRRLSELFGSDVINYYGCTESILIGAGASWYDGIYLFDDLNYIETDDQSRLVITPLTNNAFPLVRYRMDDIVEGLTKDFIPPLPFTHIDRLDGRVEELLWFENKNGKKDFLHPLFLDDLDVNGIEKYQFVQTGKSDFIIRCIASIEDKACLEKEIREQINLMLRKKNMINIKYRIEFVDRISPDPVNGKIKMVIKKERQ